MTRRSDRWKSLAVFGQGKGLQITRPGRFDRGFSILHGIKASVSPVRQYAMRAAVSREGYGTTAHRCATFPALWLASTGTRMLHNPDSLCGQLAHESSRPKVPSQQPHACSALALSALSISSKPCLELESMVLA